MFKSISFALSIVKNLRKEVKMEEEINITEIIINAINTIFKTIFSSIDTNIYSILDDITFINTDILNSPYFRNIFGTSTTNGILLIANALILGFLLYYAVKLLLSNFLITQTERPTSFIFKLIIFGICMNSSIFICDRLIFFTSCISSSIQDVGKNLFGLNINFSTLVDKLNIMIKIEENSFTIFSIDGLLKSIISISFLNLTFSYAIRYIMIKVFVLISPFAFLSLSVSSTSGFFRAWIKCFISLLLVQILVSLILLIIFSIDFSSNNIFSKFLICGAIFSLLKANSYVREFMGGINMDLSNAFNGIKSFIK